jgi:amidase
VPEVDPTIEAAVDRALLEAGFELIEVELPSWDSALEAAFWIGLPEAARNNGALADREPDLVLQRTRDAIALGRELSVREEEGRRFQRGWEAELAVALGQAELLAWPTLAGFPPPLEDFAKIDEIARCMEVNLAGLPALAQPVPTPGPLPASLQLVGPAGSEERLVATGAVVEAAAAR